MKRRFLSYTYIYIVSLLGLLAAACQSDLNGLWGGGESDGQSISVAVDIPEVRTRAIDMNAGAAVYLKNIWIGVYDKTDGTKVGGTNGIVDLRNYLAASGNTIVDLVSIEFTGSAGDNKYCVVGVANVGDDADNKIETTNGASLAAALTSANTWNDFIGIAINTRGEYNPQAPVLAGYMEKEDATSIATNGYIKVNQAPTTSANGYAINLTGCADADVYLSASSTAINTQYTENRIEKNYVLKLRRMQSRINVSINEPDEKGNNPAPNIVITNLAYKVYNNPGSAYLLQRRTNTFTDNFNNGTDKAYSPNSADVIGKDGKFDYFDDEDWTMPPISTNFSFEHFENKHWAKNTTGLTEYHDREKNDKNGVFSVLATDAADWNNNASYFVLKMNIRDEKTGKNGEILYTIHEGFINDADGREIKQQTNESDEAYIQRRLPDFSCVRNTEYFYKITVKGINDIEVQVSKEGPHTHTNDQQGSLWRMNYMVTGEDKDENGKKIDVNYVISGDGGELSVGNDKADRKLLEPDDKGEYDNASVALRLVGSYYDADKRMEIPVDLCYNFKRGDLDGFAGLWPSPTNAWTEYIVATDGKTAYDAWQEFYNDGNGESENAKNLSQFIKKVMVKMEDDDKYITIDEYITKIHGKDDEEEEGRKVVDPTVNPNISGYKVEGYKYYVDFDKDSDKKRDHLRGLYVFDKKKAFTGEERVWTDAAEHSDADPCTYLYQINAMEQVPYYLTKETHEMKYVSVDKDENPTPIDYNANKQYTNFSDGHNGTGMLLSAEPDFAFRLLGYDGDTKAYYDIWYNLGLFDYNDFFTNTSTWNAWPDCDLNNTKSVIVQKGMLGENSIPKSFLDGIKIVVINTINNTTNVYNLNDFIWQYESGKLKLTSTDKLGFEVSEYEKIAYLEDSNTDTEAKKKEKMRALYLLDRKNKYLVPAIYDGSKHEATYQAYAVEQYPNTGAAEKLVGNGIWPSSFPGENSYQFTARNFLDRYLSKRNGSYVDVVLPELDGYDRDDYKYQIEIGDESDAKWIVDVESVNKQFTFKIPMKASTGIDNVSVNNTKNNVTRDIYVRAIAVYDKYKASDRKKIGTITLEPADYDFTSQYWRTIFSTNWGGQLNHRNYSDGYITFNSPQNASNRIIQGDATGVTFKNSGCGIEFLIYKDCKMQISGNSLTNLSIVDDSGTNGTKATITSTIELGHYMNQSISIQGNGANIQKISFSVP